MIIRVEVTISGAYDAENGNLVPHSRYGQILEAAENTMRETLQAELTMLYATVVDPITGYDVDLVLDVEVHED
jgi:hypothetical protein